MATMNGSSLMSLIGFMVLIGNIDTTHVMIVVV